MQLLDAHRSALRQFDQRVAIIRPEQWTKPTGNPGWSVRDLVRHVTVEQLWVPKLLAGRSVADVGAEIKELEKDVLVADPPASWTTASAAARQAWLSEGALGRTVVLSRGAVPAEQYLKEMIFDLVVHAWDLTVAIGADEHMPNDLLSATLGLADEVIPADTDLYAPPIVVAACTDDLTELLARSGRQR